MKIFRVHAYSVIPQRKSEGTILPQGGAIRITEDIRKNLIENIQQANLKKQPKVYFVVDKTTRTNETRDEILSFAFGEPATAKKSGIELAQRLSRAMDERSSSCLFIQIAYNKSDKKGVILWIFPREDVFSLRASAKGPQIDILKNVFSQKSKLKKAALFEGANNRTQFLFGNVLDHQSKSMSQDIADFWIFRFLQCSLSIKDEAGTRILAKTIRKAYDVCEQNEDKEQLYAAVTAIRRSPHKRISLTTFASRYLEGKSKIAFLKAVPNDETKAALFNFDRNIFDSLLQFRVFQLETGVFVSSPIKEIGESVKVRTGNQKTLKVEGKIMEEKMRSRHA